MAGWAGLRETGRWGGRRGVGVWREGRWWCFLWLGLRLLVQLRGLLAVTTTGLRLGVDSFQDTLAGVRRLSLALCSSRSTFRTISAFRLSCAVGSLMVFAISTAV